MKIAFLSPFHPYRGGIAQFGNALQGALRDRHEVEAFNFTRLYPGVFFPGTTQYVHPDDPAPPFGSRRVLDSVSPPSYFRTARMISAARPDLTVIAYWMPFFVPSTGTVARLLRKSTKVVTLMHNVIPHEPKPYDRPLIRWFIRQVHGAVVMNSVSEAELDSIAGVGKPRIRIPLPIFDQVGKRIDRSEARRRLGVSDDRRLLLFFGLIREYKGLDLLIRAMDFLDDRYMLVIAGEPYGDPTTYRELITRSRLSHNIRFQGSYIPDSKVGDYFSAADVCVLPYRTATQSGITSMAYNFNLPVVVTDVGGLAEDVASRGTGVVAGPPAPEVIASGIRRFFDEGMREGCVRAIARVREEENWSSFSGKLTAFAETL